MNATASEALEALEMLLEKYDAAELMRLVPEMGTYSSVPNFAYLLRRRVRQGAKLRRGNTQKAANSLMRLALEDDALVRPALENVTTADDAAVVISDGSTAAYYELPFGAAELQDLISHRNMNAQIGEIFRACYRYGRASHSDCVRDAKKILFYAEAEVKRLEAAEDA